MCKRQTDAMHRYSRYSDTQVNMLHGAVNDLDKVSTIAAVEYQEKKVASEVVDLRKRRALYKAVHYHTKKKQMKKYILALASDDEPYEIEISSDEEINSDMQCQVKEEIRKRNIRRRNAPKMDEFCRKLK